MANRLQLGMSLQQVVMAMAGENIGAATFCLQLLKDYKKYDPQSALGGLSPLYKLDELGLYNEKIWLLWKDICNENLGKFILLFRSVQLGFLDADQLIKFTDYRTMENGLVNFDLLLEKVSAQLPTFSFNGLAK